MTPPLTAQEDALRISRHVLVTRDCRVDRRFGHLSLRMLIAVAIIGSSVGVFGLVEGTPAAASGSTCADGVTVVVDFTDLDGRVEVGCADDDPETGRMALLAAGFTAIDSQPGFLCAINSMPDPCPETFQGSFWSYWYSTPDGEWTSYQVGADSSNPTPGEIEGWRYNDGTTPPGIAPGVASAAITSPTPSATENPKLAVPSDDELTTDALAAQNVALIVMMIGILALIVILIVIFALRARRRSPEGRD